MPNWGEVLQEINQIRAEKTSEARRAVDIVRRQYLKKLFDKTQRNIIAYYSGFLSKPDILSDINDEDKNGFMMAVHTLDRSKGLDLFLHTPGGNIAATQSIVDYLHKMFHGDIRAVIPQIAMSAGTVIACSCSRILMAEHSNIGPIDPQLNGVPAYGVIAEFERACREVKDDPSRAALWYPIIGKYNPTFLDQCQNAIDWSAAFVEEQLSTVMFAGQRNARSKAKSIIGKLTDYTGNKTHSRHIHMKECVDMGLNVERLEGDPELQDLVLTIHHSFMHSLMNTPAYKMIENHKGMAFVKQVQQVIQPVIQPA